MTTVWKLSNKPYVTYMSLRENAKFIEAWSMEVGTQLGIQTLDTPGYWIQRTKASDASMGM